MLESITNPEYLGTLIAFVVLLLVAAGLFLLVFHAIRWRTNQEFAEDVALQAYRWTAAGLIAGVASDGISETGILGAIPHIALTLIALMLIEFMVRVKFSSQESFSKPSKTTSKS